MSYNLFLYIVTIFEKIASNGDIAGVAGAVRETRSDMGRICV